jgi:hypothetical protein
MDFRQGPVTRAGHRQCQCHAQSDKAEHCHDQRRKQLPAQVLVSQIKGFRQFSGT